MNLRDELVAGLSALGLTLDPPTVDALLAYMALLHKWNRVYNLTAVREPEAMLRHHLLDALSLVPVLQAHRARRGLSPDTPWRVLDVGSGGGLPGVVLAICFPHWSVDCVDTVGKKARFITQAAVEGHLPRLRGVHARVEQLKTPVYDLIVSRAFAALPDFIALSRSALAPGGVWMAMKGKHPQAEVDALPPDVEVFHVEQLTVPGLDAERCVLELRPR